MSESKHTSGPWQPDICPATQNERNIWIMVEDDKGARPIARTIGLKGQEAEFHANAHLIAAAPDLLEAAELAEATIERLAGLYMTGSAQGTLDALRAAIARAKREQS